MSSASSMKKIILMGLLILSGCVIHTPQNGSWTAYRDDRSGLIGYKDQEGHIRIEARYVDFAVAGKFDNIIAVREERNGKTEDYYLTKSGKTVEKNNIYYFDNGPDCESEGFIRFRDARTDKVGMLNGEGEIVIPAQYDDLSNVRNGLVAALKGAAKKYAGDEKQSGCNHFNWEGGEAYLIDTNNRIMVANFQYDSDLNFFSLKAGEKPSSNPNRKNFPGVDGRYYSFVDYKKEFHEWLDSALLNDLSRETLIRNAYHKIYFWKEPEGWVSETARVFVNRNYDLMKDRLMALRNHHTNDVISVDGLNPFIYAADEFDVYYNHCREPKEWQYPVMNVIIQHRDGNDDQDMLEFLRTENGYKLISMTVRHATLQ